MLLQYMEDGQLSDLLQELSNLDPSLGWSARHGSMLTIASMLRHSPSSICMSPVFPSVLSCIKDNLKDEKVISFRQNYLLCFLHLLPLRLGLMVKGVCLCKVPRSSLVSVKLCLPINKKWFFICWKLTLIIKQFPVRETSAKALGRLLHYRVQIDPSNTTGHLDILSPMVSALQDDSSEVRRQALSALKAVAKVHTLALLTI